MGSLAGNVSGSSDAAIVVSWSLKGEVVPGKRSNGAAFVTKVVNAVSGNTIFIFGSSSASIHP